MNLTTGERIEGGSMCDWNKFSYYPTTKILDFFIDPYTKKFNTVVAISGEFFN